MEGDVLENSIGSLQFGDRILAYFDTVPSQVFSVMIEKFRRPVGAEYQVIAPASQF